MITIAQEGHRPRDGWRRDLRVTQKTAWFMLHRLRHAARTRSFNRPLRGIVEVDEGYFGGKDSNKHLGKRGKAKKVWPLV